MTGRLLHLNGWCNCARWNKVIDTIFGPTRCRWPDQAWLIRALVKVSFGQQSGHLSCEFIVTKSPVLLRSAHCAFGGQGVAMARMWD
jgi:hypothetical protein